MLVVIQNFNRLETLKRLTGWLDKAEGVSGIVIHDNGSDYPPLLDWYADIRRGFDIDLVMDPANRGHLGVSEWLRTLPDEPVAVTDPDLVPLPECPRDLVPRCLDALLHCRGVNKVGPGLDLSSIPRHYPFADEVLNHERKLLGKEILPGVRKSLIDTTFAVHRCPAGFGNWRDQAARLDWPCLMEHPDWYIDPMRLSPEYVHYLDSCTASGSYACKLKRWYAARRLDYHECIAAK